MAVEHDSNTFLTANKHLLLEVFFKKTLPDRLTPLQMLISRLIRIHGNHGKPVERQAIDRVYAVAYESVRRWLRWYSDHTMSYATTSGLV